jgi:hypothetical protein
VSLVMGQAGHVHQCVLSEQRPLYIQLTSRQAIARQVQVGKIDTFRVYVCRSYNLCTTVNGCISCV